MRPPTNPKSAERQSWPKVAIIILNCNGWLDTIECLESLERLTYPNYQTIVVDNGSTDDSVEKIKAWARGEIVAESKFFECGPTVKSLRSIRYDYIMGRFRDTIGEESEIKQISSHGPLTLIEIGENLGFSGGNNVAIKYALAQGADYVLLLNNDTVVAPDFLVRMIEAAEGDTAVGVVGPKVYYYDNPEIIQYAGGSISLLTGWPVMWLNGTHDEPSLTGCREVTFVTGCSMLIRADVFKDASFLDEQYFIHVEDVDFSYQVMRAGWMLVCCLDAHVWHKVGAFIGRDNAPRVWYYDTRNRLYFVIKRTSGVPHKVIFILAFCVMRLVNFVRLPLTGRREHLRASTRGALDFVSGKMGKGFMV